MSESFTVKLLSSMGWEVNESVSPKALFVAELYGLPNLFLPSNVATNCVGGFMAYELLSVTPDGSHRVESGVSNPGLEKSS
ncbi:MAG: hypothetical protein ACJAZY_002579 [Spirosomataceae bacterium]|jgi:hypothetical protein